MKVNNRRLNLQAFTLIEALVVVVTISIIAAITIVLYTSVTGKASIASLQSDLSNAVGQVTLFNAENYNYPATVSVDCNASPTTNTNLCLKVSQGNTYTYKSDNSSDYKTYSLYISNAKGQSLRVTNKNSIDTASTLRASCLSIFNAGESAGNGVYLIRPASTTYAVYCDMTNGGWTRLNGEISSSTTAYNGNDVIIANNVPGGCGTPGCAYTISSISVIHTNIKVLMTRTTSVAQCATIESAGVSPYYWNGSGWTNSGTCTWSDGIWANGTSIDMTGLKLLWKFEGAKAGTGNIKFISQCSDGTDIGQLQFTAWVK